MRTERLVFAFSAMLIIAGCATIPADLPGTAAAGAPDGSRQQHAEPSENEQPAETADLPVPESKPEQPVKPADETDVATADTAPPSRRTTTTPNALSEADAGQSRQTGGLSAGTSPATGTDGPGAEAEGAGALSDRQRRILRAADEMLSTQNYLVSGYQYSNDCTGTILAVYAMAGIRLVDLFPRYSGNGVERLYRIAEDRALLYHDNWPRPGDLIFWDNTYDKNGDQDWNDWLTHVGLVLAIDDTGTVDYIHHDYTRGVVRARMNLLNPETHLDDDGVIVNSPMRMRSHRHLNPNEWLSSHLYRQLGALHEIDL